MSAATDLRTETIYLRLLDEGVDVWRPVKARRLVGNAYEILEQAIPEDETWEFAPGDQVTVRPRKSASGDLPTAVSRVVPRRRVKQD